MTKRPTTLLALLLTTIFLLSACGDSAPTTTSTPATNPAPTATTSSSGTEPSTGGDGIDIASLDPCTLITRSEAEAIMGTLDWKVDPPTNTVDEKRCNFAEAKIIDAEHLEGKTLEIVVWPLSYWEMQTAVNGGNPVSGAGDEAFTSDAIQWQMLWAKYNNKAIVEVHVFPKSVDTATRIANLVGSKLK